MTVSELMFSITKFSIHLLPEQFFERGADDMRLAHASLVFEEYVINFMLYHTIFHVFEF